MYPWYILYFHVHCGSFHSFNIDVICTFRSKLKTSMILRKLLFFESTALQVFVVGVWGFILGLFGIFLHFPTALVFSGS